MNHNCDFIKVLKQWNFAAINKAGKRIFLGEVTDSRRGFPIYAELARMVSERKSSLDHEIANGTSFSG
jgi:hypothetical protein